MIIHWRNKRSTTRTNTNMRSLKPRPAQVRQGCFSFPGWGNILSGEIDMRLGPKEQSIKNRLPSRHRLPIISCIVRVYGTACSQSTIFSSISYLRISPLGKLGGQISKDMNTWLPKFQKAESQTGIRGLSSMTSAFEGEGLAEMWIE